MSGTYFEGGAAESCATNEKDQALAERCGKKRPVQTESVISAPPAPRMITGHERRLIREARAIAIVKAMFQPKPPEPTPHAQRAGPPGSPGFVYFVYCARRVKIGYSTDVAERMRQLATSSPFPITLLLTVAGNEADERRFHDRFAEDRTHLEWFKVSNRFMDFISEEEDEAIYRLIDAEEAL